MKGFEGDEVLPLSLFKRDLQYVTDIGLLLFEYLWTDLG